LRYIFHPVYCNYKGISDSVRNMYCLDLNNIKNMVILLIRILFSGIENRIFEGPVGIIKIK